MKRTLVVHGRHSNNLIVPYTQWKARLTKSSIMSEFPYNADAQNKPDRVMLYRYNGLMKRAFTFANYSVSLASQNVRFPSLPVLICIKRADVIESFLQDKNKLSIVSGCL